MLQYEAKFTELAWFVHSVVADEAMKARHFEKGLRPVIRFRLATLNLQTYREVVERALLVYAELNSQKEHHKGHEPHSHPRETTTFRSE